MATNTLEHEWQSVAEALEVPAATMRLVQGSMSQLEAYHRPTAEHCKRVGILAVRIGQYAELPLKPLFYGASLHDRGKLKVTRALLDKTGEWTAEDAQALRDHPSDGYEETLNEGMVVTAGLIVRHHSFQPNAYPEQLPDAPPYMAGSFEQCARMIALADYYDAAHRPNSAGLSTEEEIKAKLLAHQADMNELVNALYEEGILGTPR